MKMDIEKVKAIVGKIDLSTHDLKPTVVVGTCDRTGRPKVSVGLTATDNGVRPGLAVRTNVSAAGIWPPHTIVLESDDEQHVHESVLAALNLATNHENREHYFVGGKLKFDPHASV